ncbi:c-type cytochrome [Sphingomonas sp. AR_OL41]|uniref:c-type cytochrome n=1 Tax=Sphingomonas sp. AR_OL41 TaxID=3042729 RepID=UPI00247FB302|nr:c-type cytochrome [Sphingomonas sp. AR_OL41]MDH7971915.1 c-type cytochrome [Sphingomonas sp. AR_OL41]
MKHLRILAAIAAMVSTGVLARAEAGPTRPVTGQALFQAHCAACHGADGSGAAGPDLHGVVNRPAAGVPDFAYSAALRRSGKIWTPRELQAFLIRPQAAVPGTRMAYPGGTAADAAAIVVYLGTLN